MNMCRYKDYSHGSSDFFDKYNSEKVGICDFLIFVAVEMILDNFSL